MGETYPIEEIDLEKFKQYQTEIMEIYMEAGTNGVHEQWLDKAKEEEYMVDIFRSGGYGYVALKDGKVIGFTLISPLSHDSLLPDSIKQKFPIDKCLYIAEMHIHKDYRGKGIGSGMIRKLLGEVDKEKWSYIFVRAWKRNEGAIRLYQRFGFQLGETIQSVKIKKDRSGTFVIDRQYLWQRV